MEPHHAVRVLHFFRNPRHELGAILRVALGEKRERSARGPGTSNVGRDINVSALNEVIADLGIVPHIRALGQKNRKLTRGAGSSCKIGQIDFGDDSQNPAIPWLTSATLTQNRISVIVKLNFRTSIVLTRRTPIQLDAIANGKKIRVVFS